MIPLLIFLCLGAAPAAAAPAACTKSGLEQMGSFAENDKLIWAQIEISQGGQRERKINVRCAARGPTTTTNPGAAVILQDPTVWMNQVIGNVEFSSVMPCRFAQMVLKAKASKKGPGDKSTALANFSSELLLAFPNKTFSPSCGAARAFSSDCKYPGQPPSETRWPEGKYLGKDDQRSWVGAVYSINNVNGQSLDSPSTKSMVHNTVFGAGATACSGEKEEDPNMDGAPVLYDGGLMIENKRGDSFTMRTFMFKNAKARDDAMKDARNLGLPYAKVFPGANGCDAEIVYAFKPKPTGGLEVTASFPFMAWTKESQQDLKDSASVYQTADEIVVSVSTKALRRAHNLAYDASCEMERTELLRFAKTFVCKTTGASVDASAVEANVWRSSAMATLFSISSDAAAPTYFRPQPRAIINTNPTIDEHSMAVKLVVSAADAPASCEAMYWDPLVLPVPGDGNSAEASADDGRTTIILIVSCSLGAIFVTCIVGTFLAFKYKKCCFKKNTAVDDLPSSVVPRGQD